MMKTAGKLGLVMEGGAMRGLFTAGVTDVLMEHGVAFDGAVGVSAGAAFGCNVKSGQAGRAIRYNLRFCRNWRYCSLRSWILTGDLYGADFCYRAIPDELDPFDYDAYARSPMAFCVVCTDAQTGGPVYRACPVADGETMLWMRASASMPAFSRPVEVDGRRLLDGGISDSIPLRWFESMGYERNVVILTQPADYVKRPNRLLPLMRPALRDLPRVYEALRHRHEAYNRQTAYVRMRAQEGAAFVIQPREALPVGHITHDPARLRAAYECGREEASRRLEALKRFLAGETA